MIAVMAVATLIAEGIVTRPTLSPRHCPATASCRVHCRSGCIHTSLLQSETQCDRGPSFPCHGYCCSVVVSRGSKSRVALPVTSSFLLQPSPHLLLDNGLRGLKGVLFGSDLSLPARTSLQRSKRGEKESSLCLFLSGVFIRRHSAQPCKVPIQRQRGCAVECLTKRSEAFPKDILSSSLLRLGESRSYWFVSASMVIKDTCVLEDGLNIQSTNRSQIRKRETTALTRAMSTPAIGVVMYSRSCSLPLLPTRSHFVSVCRKSRLICVSFFSPFHLCFSFSSPPTLSLSSPLQLIFYVLFSFPSN